MHFCVGFCPPQSICSKGIQRDRFIGGDARGVGEGKESLQSVKQG